MNYIAVLVTLLLYFICWFLIATSKKNYGLIDIALEMSVRALGFVLLTSLITSFGTNVLAAYGAGANINQFIFIPLIGLSIATSTMIGQNL